jgi:glycosyltransferase involved in cell wall biosynthesis
MTPAGCTHARVSVVISTLGTRETLRATVAGVLAQRCTNFELIVVVNGPRGSAAPDLLPDPPARVLYEPRRGQCVARNCGIRNAKGEIVAFLDDDLTIAPGWLHAIAEPFEDMRVGGVTGPVMIEGKGYLQTPVNAERFHSRWALSQENADWLGKSLSVDSGWGANMAFRRAFLLDSLFPEDLGTGSLIGGADEYFQFLQVLKNGYVLVHHPDAIVSLVFNETAEEQRRRLKQMHAGTIAFYLKLLKEQKGYRWAILKRALRGARNVATGRHSAAPLLTKREKLAAYLRGPIVYWRSRRRYGKQPPSE